MKVLIHVSSLVKAWCIPDSHVAELRAAFQDIEFLHACSAAHFVLALARTAGRHILSLKLDATLFEQAHAELEPRASANAGPYR